MNVIYKYKLERVHRQKVKMPKSHFILDLQMQELDLVLWAFVDTETPEKEIEIVLYGTGHEVNFKENLKYFGTVQISSLVLHAFEILKFPWTYHGQEDAKES